MLDRQGFSHLHFELEWVSVYTFQCRRMKSFRHGRILFAGDAAQPISSRVALAVEKVKVAIQTVGDIINQLLPDWWNTLKGWIDDGINKLSQAAGVVWDAGKWVVNRLNPFNWF
jgi:hypothetical protein